jgi:hypothetical protein
MAVHGLRLRALLLVAILATALPTSAMAQSPDVTGSTGGLLPPGEPGQTGLIEPAGAAGTLTARRQRASALTAMRVSAALASGVRSTAAAAASCPTIMVYCTAGHTVLKTSVTGKIVEPRARSRDDNHVAYTDDNYWNFCTAGAVAVATYYWQPGYVTGRTGQDYKEPYGPKRLATYWESSDTGTSADTGDGYSTIGRGYLMYIAEKVNPPIFTRVGIEDFDVYPTTGASMSDAAYALNWEISGRNPDTYEDYFYARHNPANYTKTEFINAIRSDLFDYGAPVVLGVDTYSSSTTRLPNWGRHVWHAITVIGYDNSTSKFIYTDTCGTQCNGYSSNNNGGTYSVDYAVLYSLAKAYGASLW